MTKICEHGITVRHKDHCEHCLREERDRLQSALNALYSLIHPRVLKLARKGRFIVIGEHEPYYLRAYEMIRAQEMQQGTWTKTDQSDFEAAEAAKEETDAPPD